MKKTLKLLLVVAFMAIVLFALTGCGDKLVATKTTEETDMAGNTVKYEEKVEVKFKNDKFDSMKMTYTFDKKEQAESMKAVFDLMTAFAGDEMNMDIEQSGKKLIIEVDAEAYAYMADTETEFSKDEFKELLEKDGYKVK